MGAQTFFDSLPVILAIGAAGFTYFKFFREGTHRQRIEFDIEYTDLGVVGGTERILEVRSTAENKGYVEQRFEEIRLTIRGGSFQDSTQLKQLVGHEPRLKFPKTIAVASLIPDRWEYYFVRPSVRQLFPLVVTIPARYTHILVRATFKYLKTDDIHTAERAFRMAKAKMLVQNGDKSEAVSRFDV